MLEEGRSRSIISFAQSYCTSHHLHSFYFRGDWLYLLAVLSLMCVSALLPWTSGFKHEMGLLIYLGNLGEWGPADSQEVSEYWGG